MKEKTRKEKIWKHQEQRAALPMNLTGVMAFFAGVFIFPVYFFLEHFIKIRIGLLYHRSIGRFYGNTEYFLRCRKIHPPIEREVDILISGEPVNRHILKMISRKVRVIKSDLLWRVLDTLRSVSQDSSLWIDLGNTGWLRGAEWTAPGPQLSFTPEEHERGQELLRRLGVPRGARHVCFFAKDRLYTDSPDTKLDPDSYWGSRDFRNCDIKNYLPAAQYLAAQGMYVFRMGIHKPEECLPSGLDPRIIDYTGTIRPTLDDPDFADAYIQASCKFFLGTTSGIYILSSMFGVPVASANMIPYGECGRMSHDIVIFKKCRNLGTGKFIAFPELIARGLDADWLTLDELEQLDREGIGFVENTSEEILDMAREMNERLDGIWEISPEDEELQMRYIALSPARCLDGSGFPGRVGASFLSANRHLLYQ